MKIFGIGLSRTGTTSLNDALKILGKSALHYPDCRIEISEEKPSLRRFEPFDAMTDIPVVALLPRLLAMYPESRFILTTRKKRDWLDSCRRFFVDKDRSERKNKSGKDTFFRLAVYGTPKFSEIQFSYAWDRHLSEVNRIIPKEKLLIMNIPLGDGWDELCGFLGRIKPNEIFPHRHKTRNLG
mgnify:CR=1 FL=1